MPTGVRCPRCEVLSPNDAVACGACGAPLGEARARVAAAHPAPAAPPSILKSSRPAPLKPPSLSPLPPSHRAVPAPAVDVAVAPPPPAAVPLPAPPAAPQAAVARAAARPQGARRAAPEGATARAAPAWRFAGAALLDGVLAAAPALFAAGSIAPSADAGELSADGPFRVVEAALLQPGIAVVFAGAVLLVAALHHGALVPRLGATLGGRLFGLRLVARSSGARPGAGKAALRGLVGALFGLVLLSGPLFALWLHPLRRGPGDLVAGTAPVRR